MAPPVEFEKLDQNYDARKYTVCAPWHGERNMLFRTWQRAFLAGIADEGDTDAERWHWCTSRGSGSRGSGSGSCSSGRKDLS